MLLKITYLQGTLINFQPVKEMSGIADSFSHEQGNKCSASFAKQEALPFCSVLPGHY